MIRSTLFALATCALTLAALPAESKMPAPQLFDVRYCWGFPAPDPACPVETLTLYRDGSFTADGGSGRWSTGRGGRTMTFTIDGNTTRYDGTRTSSECYQGTMTTGVPFGPAGTWDGCFR